MNYPIIGPITPSPGPSGAPSTPTEISPGGGAGSPPVPKRTRGHRGNRKSVKRRIERLAADDGEFHGNIRRPSGFLDAFLELVSLMSPAAMNRRPSR
jgi:hypothetical protein